VPGSPERDHAARVESARTLRLLVALTLVTILIVMLLHGLDVL